MKDFFNNVNKIYISVDCIIFGYEENKLKVLLMESDMPEYLNQYSLVGKIVDKDQTLEDCAKEVLQECSDLNQVNLAEFTKLSNNENINNNCMCKPTNF